MKRAGGLLACSLLLLAAMALKGLLLAPPAPAGEPVAGEFDTASGRRGWQRILGDQRPHPVDSADGDAVRERLIAEMRAVGLNPRVTDDFACNGLPKSRAVNCARVRNLVATIGPAARAGTCCSSRITTAPAGPGAADDGIGVATMLEVGAHPARARDSPGRSPSCSTRARNSGCIGARAFLERDPLGEQGRHADQSRGARRHRAGDHVRDQPAERRRRSRSTAPPPPGRSPIRSRPTSPADPQFDRRRDSNRGLDDPQLRGDRQRDPLPQRRRQSRRA